MDIHFPIKKQGGKWRSCYQRYYQMRPVPDMHFDYVLNVLREGGADVAVDFDPEKSPHWPILRDLHPSTAKTKFEVMIDGKHVLFDIADMPDEMISPNVALRFDAVFCTHWAHDTHAHMKNVFPFSVINFTDWDLFREMRAKVAFNPKAGGAVCHNQRPMGDRVRRERARQVVEREPNNSTQFFRKQTDFFRLASRSLVHVHIPGCRPDVLDRAAVQLWGLGAAVIHPLVDETFVEYGKPKEWVHYIPCAHDASDVADRIQWARENVDEVKRIGERAQHFFDTHCEPRRLVGWIRKCL